MFLTGAPGTGQSGSNPARAFRIEHGERESSAPPASLYRPWRRSLPSRRNTFGSALGRSVCYDGDLKLSPEWNQGAQGRPCCCSSGLDKDGRSLGAVGVRQENGLLASESQGTCSKPTERSLKRRRSRHFVAQSISPKARRKCWHRSPCKRRSVQGLLT